MWVNQDNRDMLSTGVFAMNKTVLWDTQSDMTWALFSAIAALVVLGRFHDRQLRERGYIS